MAAPLTYPGEYPQPLSRTTWVQVPMVSGYTTSRLSVTSGRNESLVSGMPDNTVHAVFENTSTTTSFTLQMRQADDRSASGTRTNVGSALTIVPGGRTTATLTPWQQYLEAQCTDGSGNLRAQLTSQVKWEQLAFDKSDPFYPPQLWNVGPNQDI